MSRKLDDWKQVDPENSPGPLSYLGKLFAIILVFSLGTGAVLYVVGYVQEGAQVVKEEVSPRVLLRKYVWFKDAAAALDAKSKNIEAQKARLASLKEANSEDGKVLPRSKWARTDLEESNQINAEISGLTADYNGLAAEYNAAMAKINFRFANQGSLPAGADKPLPREVRPYQ